MKGFERVGELSDPIKHAYHGNEKHSYGAFGGSDRLGQKRFCCDCTHYCFTPLLWDAALLTPLVHTLRRMRANHLRFNPHSHVIM